MSGERGSRGGMTTARIAAASFSALLALGAVGACSDEDGDGGTTDEEIQDGQETVDSLGNEVEEEVDAQTEGDDEDGERSEEHTSELQSLMRISYAVFCLKKKNK